MSEDRLARMEGKIDRIDERMASLQAMRERLDEHHEKLFGNGRPGLIKDVDRLTQWKKAIFWWVGVAVASPALAEFVRIALEK